MVQPIVAAAWLSRHVGSDEIRVVDTRWYLIDPSQGRAEYETDHIRGAVFLDLVHDLSGKEGPGRHPLPDPEAFARLLGRLGIGSNHHVVAYDGSGGAIASRLWWLLRHFGHYRVSVLDGGYPQWKESGYPVTAVAPTHRPEVFIPKVRSGETIDRDTLLASLGEVSIIDARAADRYRGDLELVDPVAGHIPTALSVPFTANLGTDGCFRSPEDLARYFRSVGLDRQQQLVSTCGSGVTACHNILAMHLAGFAQPLLYPGSWSDWSTAGFPAATGAEPGDPPA